MKFISVEWQIEGRIGVSVRDQMLFFSCLQLLLGKTKKYIDESKLFDQDNKKNWDLAKSILKQVLEVYGEDF